MKPRIFIKGRRQKGYYWTNLTRLFEAYSARRSGTLDAQFAIIKRSIPGFRASPVRHILKRLVREANMEHDRLPCLMGLDIDKCIYNLHYQDTRVKLELEQLCKRNVLLENRHKCVHACLRLIAWLLTGRVQMKKRLWQQMNDNDLDALVFAVIEGCNPNHHLDLLKSGFESNQLALNAFPRHSVLATWPAERIIAFEVFAGVVWWSKHGGNCDNEFPKTMHFGVDDRKSFLNALTHNVKRMIVFGDDNGELAWDMLLCKVLLERCEFLRITFVTNANPVANNANLTTLNYCLNHPSLSVLRKEERFRVVVEENPRSSLEPQFFSEALAAEVKRSDIAFLKGCGLFETCQRLAVPAFYAFVVHSRNAEITTGLRRGTGVFVGLPPNTVAYDFRRRTLVEFRRRNARQIASAAFHEGGSSAGIPRERMSVRVCRLKETMRKNVLTRRRRNEVRKRGTRSFTDERR